MEGKLLNNKGYLTIELIIIIPIIIIILIVLSLFQIYFFQKTYLQMQLNHKTLTGEALLIEKEILLLNQKITIDSEFKLTNIMQKLFIYNKKQNLKEWFNER